SEALLGALKSKHRGVRLWAVQRLSAQHDRAVVDALIEMLGDADGAVRGHAGACLRAILDKRAVPALAQRVTDSAYSGAWAKDQVKEALNAAAQSQNHNVKKWANAQMEAIKDK